MEEAVKRNYGSENEHAYITRVTHVTRRIAFGRCNVDSSPKPKLFLHLDFFLLQNLLIHALVLISNSSWRSTRSLLLSVPRPGLLKSPELPLI